VTTDRAEIAHLVNVNGVDLYVRAMGQGHPIVLVQPGLVSSRVYENLAAQLAERFRVIIFDSRGHGDSTNPSGELSFELLAEDTAELIRALDLQRPFIGGWSDGGEVALQVELRHPGLARGLIVGGDSVEMGGSERARTEVRAFLHANDDNVVDIDAFARAHESSLLPLLRQSHPNGEAQWQNVVRWSANLWLTYAGLSRDEAARIAAPTLVIAGDHDEFHPIEGVVQLFRWLPDAELAILPGSSHMRPVFEPAILTSVLIDFLARHVQ
jgi:pimeloyl-ACP methyl ester carboxylesterase